jgi:hypothetical protein
MNGHIKVGFILIKQFLDTDVPCVRERFLPTLPGWRRMIRIKYCWIASCLVVGSYLYSLCHSPSRHRYGASFLFNLCHSVHLDKLTGLDRTTGQARVLALWPYGYYEQLLFWSAICQSSPTEVLTGQNHMVTTTTRSYWKKAVISASLKRRNQLQLNL